MTRLDVGNGGSVPTIQIINNLDHIKPSNTYSITVYQKIRQGYNVYQIYHFLRI